MLLRLRNSWPKQRHLDIGVVWEHECISWQNLIIFIVFRFLPQHFQIISVIENKKSFSFPNWLSSAELQEDGIWGVMGGTFYSKNVEKVRCLLRNWSVFYDAHSGKNSIAYHASLVHGTSITIKIILITIITLCCAHYNNNNNNSVLCAL